ncbi:MAG: tRNA dihydrouridine synthase DusB [Verrucomicrobiae bacterium]|nr:tRNA dihydrouridine synthase DusB [Verrucomicrobiae bacterium]
MFKIGTLELATNLLLSPLAGYTNLPMRLTVREIGGLGLATTDLVNARSLLEKNRKALHLIETAPGDEPLAVQLFGSIPEEMRDAAQFLETLGVHSVDVNMGCPVRKVCAVGGGSAMMKQTDATAQLVRAMVEAVKIPVTCKMRLGWDDGNWTAPELARALEGVGVAAIAVHGRTREQGFNGHVKLAGIRQVVEAVRIPVIGNGDVTTPQGARRMIEETGCAAVSVGRGAFYNPWIFRHTEHYLRTGELLAEPTFEERLRVMCRHFGRMMDVFGESLGSRMFRKVGPWYARRFGPANFFNKRIVLVSTRAEFETLVEEYRQWRLQFVEESGELRHPFRLQPMESVFAEDLDHLPESTRREAIPVPPGPVDLW